MIYTKTILFEALSPEAMFNVFYGVMTGAV